MAVRITSSSVNSNNFAKMIVGKHQPVAHSKVISRDVSRDISGNENRDVSKNIFDKLSGKTPMTSSPSKTPEASNEEIQFLKSQLEIGSQNYQTLMNNYHYMSSAFESIKSAYDNIRSEHKRLNSQVEELTTKNQILEQKASGNQDDFVDTKQELSDSREKYQKLQARMYKILGTVPALSFINPNDANAEVKVSGKVIGFTYNQYNGKITGARVVVDCEINPMLFAFNQFWLNYDKNIEIENWDKVVIFCPGGLSNVNHLEENSTVMVKLITNQKPKANKTPNTIGIIMKD